LDWSTAIWERDFNIQSSLEEFKNRLCEVFDHPHEAKEAEEQLRALCQEHQTAADCALTSEPLRVRVELACRDDNFTLEKYIQLSIRIDNLSNLYSQAHGGI